MNGALTKVIVTTSITVTISIVGLQTTSGNIHIGWNMKLILASDTDLTPEQHKGWQFIVTGVMTPSPAVTTLLLVKEGYAFDASSPFEAICTNPHRLDDGSWIVCYKLFKGFEPMGIGYLLCKGYNNA